MTVLAPLPYKTTLWILQKTMALSVMGLSHWTAPVTRVLVYPSSVAAKILATHCQVAVRLIQRKVAEKLLLCQVPLSECQRQLVTHGLIQCLSDYIKAATDQPDPDLLTARVQNSRSGSAQKVCFLILFSTKVLFIPEISYFSCQKKMLSKVTDTDPSLLGLNRVLFRSVAALVCTIQQKQSMIWCLFLT